jgi:hypothetical protein
VGDDRDQRLNRLAISQRTPPKSLGGPAPAEHSAIV